jgi:hypothetical protein
MSKYEDMTKAQLMECIEMASEDAHADAKRQRWTKAVLVEWLNGFAEQTDVAPSVAEESESAETESTQTDSADDTQEDTDDRTTFTFNGAEYSRKIKVQRRTGRRWARVAKSYVEVLDDGSAVIWKD